MLNTNLSTRLSPSICSLSLPQTSSLSHSTLWCLLQRKNAIIDTKKTLDAEYIYYVQLSMYWHADMDNGKWNVTRWYPARVAWQRISFITTYPKQMKYLTPINRSPIIKIDAMIIRDDKVNNEGLQGWLVINMFTRSKKIVLVGKNNLVKSENQCSHSLQISNNHCSTTVTKSLIVLSYLLTVTD